MFDDNKELNEYEAMEIENSIVSRVDDALKTDKMIKDDYERKTNGNGVLLMLAQLTGWKRFTDKPEIKGMMELASKIFDGCSVDKDLLDKLYEEDRKQKDSMNMAGIAAFGVALTDNCVDKDLQNHLLQIYDEQKKYYLKQGEMHFTAFCINVEEFKHWVNEMALKEQVYAEIEEFEKNEE
jgi:hypothetical protein